jgi:carbonic anhydrase/acetyltransferase-like protein (isoleucine patch superfamily)
MTEDVIVVGDVRIAEGVSIWFGSVIRGDVNRITIGARTNIQDNCTLHVTWKKAPLVIGADVTVGHGAVLHGCSIEDSCLIGMGAKLLDNAVIGEQSIVGAGAIVLEGFEVPPGSLVAGVPARVLRPLADKERSGLRQWAGNYELYVQQYRKHRDLECGLDFHSYLEYKRTGRI